WVASATDAYTGSPAPALARRRSPAIEATTARRTARTSRMCRRLRTERPLRPGRGRRSDDGGTVMGSSRGRHTVSQGQAPCSLNGRLPPPTNSGRARSFRAYGEGMKANKELSDSLQAVLVDLIELG